MSNPFVVAVAPPSLFGLTKRETALMAELIRREDVVVDKLALHAALYGVDDPDLPELKIIDIFVCKMRSKLAPFGLRDCIETIWGRGYAIRGVNRVRLLEAALPAQTERAA